jgi:diguanylate cyclase (GGDEF)-like protein
MMLGENDLSLPGDILTILRELGVSSTNHGKWLKRLHRSIICRTEIPAADLTEAAHRHCEFGTWYYGDVNARLKAQPLFDEIGELHRRLHGRARRLLEYRQAGREITARDYDAFTDIAQQFQLAVQNLQFSIVNQVCAVDRYAMCHKLSQEEERVRRSGDPCSIALIDFDYFKSINDRYGHLAGDEVLKTVATFLVGEMRRYDLLFRFGGEEFLFLFPATALDQAEELLDRLRQGIRGLDIMVSAGSALRVTVSAGLALLDAESEALDVVHLADRALMNAKLAGRDCVRVWR